MGRILSLWVATDEEAWGDLSALVEAQQYSAKSAGEDVDSGVSVVASSSFLCSVAAEGAPHPWTQGRQRWPFVLRETFGGVSHGGCSRVNALPFVYNVTA
eukprot:g2163.t1